MLLPDAGLPTRKQNMGEVILQIQSSSHYKITNTDKNNHRVYKQHN
jgi:hypothetical protein